MFIDPVSSLHPLDPVPVGGDQPDHGMPHEDDVGEGLHPQPPLDEVPGGHLVLQGPRLDSRLQLCPVSGELVDQGHHETGGHFVIPAIHQLNKRKVGKQSQFSG